MFTTRSVSMDTLSSISPSKPISAKRSSKKPAATTQPRRNSKGAGSATVGQSTLHVAQQAKPGTATDAVSPKDLKRRAGYKSDPTPLRTIVEERAITAIDDMADKPVINETPLSVPKGNKLGFWERRSARNKPVLVIEDLYWFLVGEFAFVPRTAEVLRQMKAKSKQFLAMHDITGLSLQFQYQMVMATITRCMDIPHEEQLCRQALKNDVANEERVKQQKLVTSGIAGKSGFGFFGTNHALPASKK